MFMLLPIAADLLELLVLGLLFVVYIAVAFGITFTVARIAGKNKQKIYARAVVLFAAIPLLVVAAHFVHVQREELAIASLCKERGQLIFKASRQTEGFVQLYDDRGEGQKAAEAASTTFVRIAYSKPFVNGPPPAAAEIYKEADKYGSEKGKVVRRLGVATAYRSPHDERRKLPEVFPVLEVRPFDIIAFDIYGGQILGSTKGFTGDRLPSAMDSVLETFFGRDRGKLGPSSFARNRSVNCLPRDEDYAALIRRVVQPRPN